MRNKVVACYTRSLDLVLVHSGSLPVLILWTEGLHPYIFLDWKSYQ